MESYEAITKLLNTEREEKYTYQVNESWSIHGHYERSKGSHGEIEELGLDYAIAKAKKEAIANRGTMYVTKIVAKITSNLKEVDVTVEMV